MIDRDFCAPREFANLSHDLDRHMADGRVMKDIHNSRSTGVSRVSLLGRDVMIKRYNHKGLAHAVGRTIEGSRAKWSWFRSHVLQTARIASPRPLALAEIRRGPLVWKSYMLYEYVPGRGLDSVLKDGHVRQEDLDAAAREVHTLLSSLWDRRITHGDLKLQNILLGSGTATLIDIDQMRVHLGERSFRSAQKKDLATLRHYLRRFERSESLLAGFEDGTFQFQSAAD